MHAKFGVHPGCGCEAPPRAKLGAPSQLSRPTNRVGRQQFSFFRQKFSFFPQKLAFRGKKLAFLLDLARFRDSQRQTPESDGGDSWTVTATLSPDDSEFLTAARRRVLLRAPLEPFFVRARHRAAAVLAAGVHDR